MTAYDAKVRLEVVEALVDNPDLDAAAQTCGLGRSEVLDIASHHGYPVFDNMMKARDVLAGMVKAANAPAESRSPLVDRGLADFGRDFDEPVGYAPRGKFERFKRPGVVSPVVEPAVMRGASSAAAQELVDVPVADLHPDADNPREDINADLDDLVASITQAGLLQPIVAQRRPDGTLQIVAGHRRHAACKRLGWPTVPCVVREEMGRAEVLAAMLIENSQRRDLDPIQEARAVQHLMVQYSISTHSQVGAKIGKSQVWVSSRLALLALTPEDQRRVRSGELRVQDAVARGRAVSGRARGHRDTGPHLSETHRLVTFARQLCAQNGHPRGTHLARTACGACWEQVIRADERRKIVADSVQTGTCACCDREMP